MRSFVGCLCALSAFLVQSEGWADLPPGPHEPHACFHAGSSGASRLSSDGAFGWFCGLEWTEAGVYQPIEPCLAVSLADGTPSDLPVATYGYVPPPAWDAPPAPGADVATIAGEVAHVCIGGVCRDFTLSGIALREYSNVTGTLDPTGAHVLISVTGWDANTEEGPVEARIFNWGTSAQENVLPAITTTEEGCGWVSWVGSRVLMTKSVCAGPGDNGAIYDPATNTVTAEVGGPDNRINLNGGGWVQVDGDWWALNGDFGHEVLVQNLATGEIRFRANLGEAFYGDPGVGSFDQLASGELLVLIPAYDAAHVAVVDPNSGAVVRSYSVPACAQP